MPASSSCQSCAGLDTGSLPDDTLQAYTRACPPDSAYTAADVIGLVNSLGNSYRLIFQTEAVQPLPEITNIIASLLSVAQYSSGSIDQTYEQGGNNWLTLIRVSLTAGQESTQTLLSGVVGYQLTVPVSVEVSSSTYWYILPPISFFIHPVRTTVEGDLEGTVIAPGAAING